MDEKIMQKAEVLIEALPYIQRFNRKIIVVKYGGSAMVDDELEEKCDQGRGAAKAGGIQAHHCARRRKGDQQLGETAGHGAEICERTAGDGRAHHGDWRRWCLNRVNKGLVQMVQELGVKAVGISGKDGRISCM